MTIRGREERLLYCLSIKSQRQRWDRERGGGGARVAWGGREGKGGEGRKGPKTANTG